MTPVEKAESVREIEREVTVLVHRVRRTSAELAALVHPDLQPAAYAVLLHVASHEPTTASEVVELIGVDKGSVSRQLHQLEQLGLVTRSCDPADRRVHHLVVTDDGRARLELAAQRRRTEFAGRLSSWSPEDLTEFARQLGRYNAALEG